jgi:hypothetical protein
MSDDSDYIQSQLLAAAERERLQRVLGGRKPRPPMRLSGCLQSIGLALLSWALIAFGLWLFFR